MAGYTAAAALLGLVALVYGMVYGVSWLAGVAPVAVDSGAVHPAAASPDSPG